MAALTTSQSATTKSIIPIGIALGLPAQLIIAMWPSLIGVYFLPANGTQLAAIAADRTGSTKIGSFVINHSFQPNTIIMWIVSVVVGSVLALAHVREQCRRGGAAAGRNAGGRSVRYASGDRGRCPDRCGAKTRRFRRSRRTPVEEPTDGHGGANRTSGSPD